MKMRKENLVFELQVFKDHANNENRDDNGGM